jgi:hypothetical protein
MAAAKDQLSEGCSPAVEMADYEDYATYFFAALTGRPRDHAGLNGKPDWNLDGVVTPLEAHFHVLSTAFSADIPRSTSEVLLMQWQPGNLEELLADGSGEKNEYTELAREMMRHSGIDPHLDPGKEMHWRKQRLDAQWDKLEEKHEHLLSDIVSLQGKLKREVLRRWPQAGAAYTIGYKRFLEEDLDSAQAFIVAHPSFVGLRDKQRMYLAQEDQALRLRRDHNQLQKIDHVLRLGKLKATLERVGPPELLERYRTLRECESSPF